MNNQFYKNDHINKIEIIVCELFLITILLQQGAVRFADVELMQRNTLALIFVTGQAHTGVHFPS